MRRVFLLSTACGLFCGRETLVLLGLALDVAVWMLRSCVGGHCCFENAMLHHKVSKLQFDYQFLFELAAVLVLDAPAVCSAVE